MDVFARGLLAADAILRQSDYKKWRAERYASFDSGKGKDFENGALKLEDLYYLAHQKPVLPLTSGKQELYENLINQFV